MSVSYKEAAAGLSAALESGNTQDAIAAQALYAEALGDDEPAEVVLGPIKRSTVDEEPLEDEELLDESEIDEA